MEFPPGFMIAEGTPSPVQGGAQGWRSEQDMVLAFPAPILCGSSNVDTTSGGGECLMFTKRLAPAIEINGKEPGDSRGLGESMNERYIELTPHTQASETELF